LRTAELAERLDAGTVWVNTWLNRELHMPFGGVKQSGVAREGGAYSLDFYSELSAVCMKRGSRAPLAMPGAFGARRFGTARRFSSGAPTPMGAYVHAKRAGQLLFLAGIGPRVPETDEVPGGPVSEDGRTRRSYDVAAQTRQCFANVRTVLASHGLSLADVIDVQCFLIDMQRDFKSFNAVYAEEMAGHSATRTTIAITELPPGGRIAVELKVIALCPS
jgi:2-aminomuconate deaminase